MKDFFHKYFGSSKSSGRLQKSTSETEKKVNHREDKFKDYDKNNSLFLSFESDASSSAVASSKLDDIGSPVYSFNVKIGEKGIMFSPPAPHCQEAIPYHQSTTSFLNNCGAAIVGTPKKKVGDNQVQSLGFGLDSLSTSTPLSDLPLRKQQTINATVPFGKQVKNVSKNIRKYEHRMAKTTRIIKRLMSGKNPTADDLFSIEDDDSEEEKDDVLNITMCSSSQMPTEKDMDNLCQRSNQLLYSWEVLHNCLLEGIGMDAIRPKNLSKSFAASNGRHNQSETE